MATITFIGGAQQVTGSCYLLSIGSKNILLECGMRQGRNIVKSLSAESFPFSPEAIDAVILSHAHLDHSGLLPLLFHRGFRGPVFCAKPTEDLIGIMLEDAAGIYFRDLDWENKRKRRAGHHDLEAQYSLDDVQAVVAACTAVPYEHSHELFEGVRVRFKDAGHIIGSAIVELTITDQGQEKVLVFSGDLGNPDTVLMRDPTDVKRADLVLMEGTYGNRNHKNASDTLEEFAAILAEAKRRNGNVLIPAFALGRTQEILFHLTELYRQGRLPQQRIFLDSPMAIDITRLYGQSLECLDAKDLERINYVVGQLFEDTLPMLQYSKSTEDSMAINRIEGGAIIIAGSGMCNGGRIRHHLKHNLWKASTQIVFVGYQAQGTLGRLLVDGAEQIRMFGTEFAVKASIHTLGGFSAHAGQSDLLAWAGAIESPQSQGAPQFCLVHGDPDALEALKLALAQRQGIEACIPVAGQKINF